MEMHKQLLGDLMETKGYWKLHEMALFGELPLKEAIGLA
jgi:hypothetical protein